MEERLNYFDYYRIYFFDYYSYNQEIETSTATNTLVAL